MTGTINVDKLKIALGPKEWIAVFAFVVSMATLWLTNQHRAEVQGAAIKSALERIESHENRLGQHERWLIAKGIIQP